MALKPTATARNLGLAFVGLLAAAPALATSARLAALGGGLDYLRDERAVLRWYASGIDHDGLAVFDLGRFDTGGGGRPWSDRIGGQAGGLHVRLDPDGDWGTTCAYFHSEAVQAAPSQVHADYPGGCFSLGWARRCGAWDLGLGFRGTTYAEVTSGNGDGSVGREDYRHDWGLGLRRHLGEHDVLEIAGELRNVMFRMVDTGRGIEEPGSTNTGSWGLRARASLRPAGAITLIPLLDYSRDRQTVYSLQLEDVAGLDARLLRVGLGCRFDGAADEHLLVSCEYRDGHEDHDGHGGIYRAADTLRRDWWTLHVRAAVESDVLSWLTVRMSLQYRRIDDEATTAWNDGAHDGGAGVDARRVVDVPLGLGASVNHGRLGIDASYNDRSPLSTTNVPDANAPREAANFAMLSARWAF